MTVLSTINKISFTCTGVQEFPFTFKIFEKIDLVVILRVGGSESVLALTSDYTINTGPWPTGGTVTTLRSYTEGTLVIVRELPQTQKADYVENDLFPAETHEEGLDRAVMLLQELSEVLGRMPILSKSSPYSALSLPDPIASKLLAWKDDLSGLKNVGIESEGLLAVTDTMKTLLDDESINAARTTLGLNHQPFRAEWANVSSSATAVQNDTYMANAFAAGSHITLITPGTYNFDTVVVPSNKTIEIGPGVIINKSECNVSNYLFQIIGTKGTDTTTLSVDATMGANSITVADATDFSAGTFFYMKDEEWDGTLYTYKHEVNVVDAVVGTVLKLKYPICNYYKTTENAAITKIDAAKEKIHILGKGKITTSLATASYGIYMEYCAEVKIMDLEIRGFYNHQLSVRYSVDCLIGNNDVGEGIAFASGQGYGMAITSGTSHSSVVNNRLRKLRHCLVTGVGATFNLFTGNHCHGYHTHALDGIDTHGGMVHHNKYTHNYVSGMKQDGINGNDPFNEFTDNVVVGCERHGIRLGKYVHDDITSLAGDCVVRGNTVRHYASDQAIVLSSHDSTDDTDTTILDNLIVQDNNISLHAAAGEVDVCGIYGRGIGGLIDGNKIRYENPAQTDASSRAIDIQEWEADGNYGLISKLKVSNNYTYGGHYGVILKGDAHSLEVCNNRCEEAYNMAIALYGRGAANRLIATAVEGNRIIHSGNLSYAFYLSNCRATDILSNLIYSGGTLDKLLAEAETTSNTRWKGNKLYGTVTTPFTLIDPSTLIGEVQVVKWGNATAQDQRAIFVSPGSKGALVVEIAVINNAAIAQHDSNYLTFQALNKGDGEGSDALVTVTTEITGGIAVPRWKAVSLGTIDISKALFQADQVMTININFTGTPATNPDEMLISTKCLEY